MQLICNYKPTPMKRLARRRRRALTLLELIVVLAILVTLSGMVVPLIEGLGRQTNSSSNATVINDVNRAIGTCAMRHELGYFPDGWDSLLNTSGALFSGLHLNVSGTMGSDPISGLVEAKALTDTQLKSLSDVNLRTVYDAASTSPNVFTSLRPLQSGGKVAMLTDTAKNRAYGDDRFSVKHLDMSGTHDDKDFVVLGLGGMNSLRGNIVRDVPLISSADPNNHYARVLCVFMIPDAGSTAALFPAKYIGCFMPDGTSLRMNLDDYNNARKDL